MRSIFDRVAKAISEFFERMGMEVVRFENIATTQRNIDDQKEGLIGVLKDRRPREFQIGCDEKSTADMARRQRRRLRIGGQSDEKSSGNRLERTDLLEGKGFFERGARGKCDADVLVVSDAELFRMKKFRSEKSDRPTERDVGIVAPYIAAYRKKFLGRTSGDHFLEALLRNTIEEIHRGSAHFGRIQLFKLDVFMF